MARRTKRAQGLDVAGTAEAKTCSKCGRTSQVFYGDVCAKCFRTRKPPRR